MSFEFKKILCPVDLSEFSLEALRLAVKIAESGDATLDIVHVIHNPFDGIYLTDITQTNPALIEAYADEPQRRAKVPGVRTTLARWDILPLTAQSEDVAKVGLRVKRFSIQPAIPWKRWSVTVPIIRAICSC